MTPRSTIFRSSPVPPFLHYTQSETTVAAHGQNIVVSYNNSAGITLALNPSGPGLVFTRFQLSGYSFSGDGGKTWTSDYVPAPLGVGPVTFGDGVVVVDRRGTFYYSSLGQTADGHGAVVVNPKQPVRKLSLLRWGLIPSWSNDASGGARMINARSETAHTLPAFRDAMKLRRCLVPADGFYEWKRTGSRKQPFCFEVNDGELFAFAGLWDRWKDPTGQWIRSCSILTTTPNAVTSAVHDRMPVILNKEDYDLWLDPGMTNVEALSGLLKPYDARLMRRYPVSNRVNQVQNDDENCSKPIELEPLTQGQLFHAEGF